MHTATTPIPCRALSDSICTTNTKCFILSPGTPTTSSAVRCITCGRTICCLSGPPPITISSCSPPPLTSGLSSIFPRTSSRKTSRDCSGDIGSFTIFPKRPTDHIFYGLLQAAENFSQKDARLALIQEINLVLLYLKYASYQGGQPQKRHDVLDNILKFIDENLTSPLNAQVIAEKFYVSSSWISHTFGDFFGIGVSQYINRKKILYAQQLIKSGVPPTKAAEICAYNNYSTFYRQYRQFLAFDPTDDKWEEYSD